MTTKQDHETESAKNACLACGRHDKRLIRGLCPAHHAQYLREVAKAVSEGKDATIIDAHLIGRGLLAPSKQGRRLKSGENVFQNALAELFGEGKTIDHVELAEHMAEQAADEQAAEKPPRKGRAGAKKKKT